MTRITSRWLVVLGLTLGFAVFAVVDGLSSSVVRAVPLPPAVFFGNVTVAGSPAAGGIPIEARINGFNYAFSSTAANNTPTTASDGTYGFGFNIFQVLADDPSTSAVEGGTTGDTIAFLVGGSSAGSATFTGGSVTQLNLVGLFHCAPSSTSASSASSASASAATRRRSARRYDTFSDPDPYRYTYAYAGAAADPHCARRCRERHA